MTQHDAHSKQYHQAREAFDDLKIEDRAVFLLEATVSTVARGVEEAGRILADELDRLFSSFRKEEPEASRGTASPGPAEPPTAEQVAPRTRKKKDAPGEGEDADV